MSTTMEALFSAVLGFSVSGGLIILVLLGCGRLLKGRLGWGWLYYLWLAAVFRLLLPFSLKIPIWVLPDIGMNQMQQGQQIGIGPVEMSPKILPENPPYQAKTFSAPLLPFWSIWIAGAGISFTKRCLDYRRFFRYLQKGWNPVSNSKLLARFQRLAVRAGIRGKVRFYVHPDLSTPMLIGLLHPCVILPCLELPKSELDFTILHELSHCCRKDILYKLLIQICLCLHWFNPLVYRMEWELNRLCELACDEIVLKNLAPQKRAAYGDTLVNSLLYFGRTNIPKSSPALKRENNLLLLKERLDEMMKPKRKTKTIMLLSASITCAVICTSAITGVQANEDLSGFNSNVFAELQSGEYQNLFAILNPVSASRIEGNPALAVKTNYIYPVKENGYISAEYTPSVHNGIDIAAEKGTSIYAVADGIVKAADMDVKCGRYIVLLHNDGTESRYYHCNELFVTAEQKVRQGDKIAEIGETGYATGPHLHIEFTKGGQLQDPANYLEYPKTK